MRTKQDIIDICLIGGGACVMGIGIDRYLFDTPCNRQTLEVSQGEKREVLIPYSVSEQCAWRIKSLGLILIGMGCTGYGANSFLRGGR